MATEEDLPVELAREIRAAVAEAAPAPRPPREVDPAASDLEDVRMPLARAEAYVTPTIPDDARLSRAKSAVIRLLRFLWRDQSSFNALTLEAAGGLASGLQRTERRLGELTAELERWRTDFEKEARRRDSAQDTRIAYLESLSSRAAPAAGAAPATPALPESVYSLFEERFRGPSAEVAEKQRFYLPFVSNLPGPVFDAGCGRGEFLAILKKEGIAARGVETSSVAVQACRAAGLDVREGDAIEALAGVATASLGGVVAFQVVEHWPAAATFRFLAEARRAIAPGGVLIVETVNTDSLAAMNAFYLDPTHVRPVPPEALRFLCDAAGFRELRVEFLSPLPASERLEESSKNDARLNAVLFGPQDYAVIGRVPPS